MYITKVGSDIISINESNLHDTDLINIPRVHLIKLDFEMPNEKKIRNVMSLYPKTNRYIIKDNIKIYNYILKTTSKKYYVENKDDVSLISFFRKNNKIFMNFMNLSIFDRNWLLMDKSFKDLLLNVEVILISRTIYEEKKVILMKWSGNVIIDDGKYGI